MSLIETKTGRKYFRKPESMMLIPYVYDNSWDDYVLGSDIYDISAIIGDSITLELEDGDAEEKFNEFVSTPIVRNVSAGSYNFSAQCLDLQDNVLQVLFGAYTTSVDGVVALPDGYKEMYAMILIRFKDHSLSDIVLPKVQMNNKLMLQQMKSGVSQGNIVGTALPHMIAVASNENDTVLAFDTSDVIYAPRTPVLFLPRERESKFFVYDHSDSYPNYMFSMIDFSGGMVEPKVIVDISNGTFAIKD